MARIEKILEITKEPCNSPKEETYEEKMLPIGDGAKHPMLKLPAFEKNGDPEHHIPLFTKSTVLGGVDEEYYDPHLGTSFQNWNSQLDPLQIPEQSESSQLSLEQHTNNVTTPVTLEKLSRQYEGEAFMTFLRRWRLAIMELRNPLSEAEQVWLFIQNLQPKYFEPLKVLTVTKYDELYGIGSLICDDLLEAHTTKRYAVTEPCHITMKKPAPQISTAKPIRDSKMKKPYTPLTVPVVEAFDKLLAEGHIAPIGPTPDPPENKRSKLWNSLAYCEYHRGRGHKTSSCYQLRDKIQDLIDKGVIAAPYTRES